MIPRSCVRYRWLLFVLLPLLAGTAAHSYRKRSPSYTQTVNVTGGKITGVMNDGISSFKGIPFAAPPVGKLRWKAPQPVKPWTGIKKADAFAAAPMQDATVAKLAWGAKTVSEDCLYLNVWTPTLTPHERLPVMVWIYGGAFVTGATSAGLYDGTQLAKKGVVVVSVAYRLGAFGFLAHPELSAESGKGSGNYGLQDQIAALKWVKENIAHFGGDPARVTIFGESAGAIAVSLLMCAPSAKGLFQRAISESGVMMAPVSQGSGPTLGPLSLPEAQKRGTAFLAKLGIKDIPAARALSAEQVLKANSDIHEPVADGMVLPGSPYELLEAGRFAEVPLLAGWNADDGAMFAPKTVSPDAFVAQIRKSSGSSADALLSVYPHATPAQAQKSMKEILRDLAFAWPAWVRASLMTRRGKSKVYLYYFDFTPNNAPDGPGHGAEIPYVFGNMSEWFHSSTPAERKISEQMMAYWVNFARSGNPNGVSLPDWSPFNAKTMQAMYLGQTVEMRPIPGLEKIQALDAFYAQQRRESKATPKH